LKLQSYFLYAATMSARFQGNCAIPQQVGDELQSGVCAMLKHPSP